MIIGAYSFPLCGNVQTNLAHIKTAILCAVEKRVKLLLLPECALTGYPGDDPKTTDEIDFQAAQDGVTEIEALSAAHDIAILCGSVERVGESCYNSALFFSPNEHVKTIYRKRALWGWDLDHFSQGDDENGIVEIEGFRIGVRICYEIRFPEYFRELFRQKADCAAVLFCDRSDEDSEARYDLILSHLRTRAVENVFPLVCVNSCSAYQTAPSAAIDEDGVVQCELSRHQAGLLIFDLQRKEKLSFGAQGRKAVSSAMVKQQSE